MRTSRMKFLETDEGGLHSDGEYWSRIKFLEMDEGGGHAEEKCTKKCVRACICRKNVVILQAER